MSPVVELTDAEVRFGTRTLWSELDLRVEPGEFITVLGGNGTGKTTLLKVLLGLLPLSAGTANIAGRPATTGHSDVGYIPQQKSLDETLPLRGRDLVGLGVDGHRWGLGFIRRHSRRAIVDRLVADVGATAFAHRPIGRLSGGEQQRLRVAAALAGDPKVLLCDEPLLSLDLPSQQLVAGLINRRRKVANTAVIFVTHEINPVLRYTDRVLYLANGRFRLGTPDEVINSKTLSDLYQTDVDVLKVRGRYIVVGADEEANETGHHHHHHEEPA
ncbi:MAG: ATP-binding cassette domain-containing protein [Nocardiaceae bacterium]|nr:ATP-binding cassette domain-containing protein [Nocardiaceae bacterium]